MSGYEMQQTIGDAYTLAPPYFLNLRESQLDQIASLGRNWNGEGAGPVDKEAIRNARAVLEGVPESLLERCDIYPLGYGNVCIEFGEEGRMVSLECGRSAMGLFTDFKDGRNVIMDNVPCGFGNIPDKIYEQIVRLYPGVGDGEDS